MNTLRSLIIVTTFLLIVILPEFALCRSPYADDDYSGTMPHSFFHEPQYDYQDTPKQKYISPDSKPVKPFVLRDTHTRTFFAPPPNDNFADRITVVGHNTSAMGSNVDATVEPNEPTLHKQHGSNSVWWTWTPTISGSCSIDTGGSSFDTYLAVYTGDTLATLYLIASNDDSIGLQSKVTFSVQAGTPYQVAVFGFSPASEGAISLNFNIFDPPPNDTFADAIMISGASGMANGVNYSATSESGERPILTYGNGRNSVWWKWTAPTDGIYAFDTFGTRTRYSSRVLRILPM